MRSLLKDMKKEKNHGRSSFGESLVGNMGNHTGNKNSGRSKRLFWLTNRLEAGVINPI